MPKKISILYVSYNSTNLIAESIQSLLPFLHDFDFEFLIWENGMPVSEMKLSENIVYKYFQDGKNLGFGGGINRLYAQSIGEFLLIINPDTIAVKIEFNQLIGWLENGEIGLIGCQHIDSNNLPTLTILTQPSLIMVLQKLFFLNTISEKFRIRKETEACEIITGLEAVNGSFLFIRRSDFEDAGKFDEQFFLYCEEIDLCRRVRGLGKQIAFSKNDVIQHIMGQSTPNHSFQLHNVFVSENIYAKKYHSTSYWILFRVLNLTDKLVRGVVNGLLGVILFNGDLIKKSNNYLRVFKNNIFDDRYYFPNEISH